MSNPSVVKTYVHMLNTSDMATVTELYNNVTMNANNHPRYTVIKEAYEARLNAVKE
jgi:hypothetical protein